MLTPENTAAIRERAEKATAGPWKFEDEHELKGATNTQIYSEPCADHEQNDRDKDFIAHSRTDIPALLAHVEELEAKHAKAFGIINTLERKLAELGGIAYDPNASQSASAELLKCGCRIESTTIRYCCKEHNPISLMPIDA